jgi:hypothetical protein
LDGGRIFAGQHVSRSTPSSKTSGRVVVVARHNAASATQIKRHAKKKESFKTNLR